jgi:hypothetical protein
VTFAICAPVTRPTLAPGGRPSTSASHSAATASTAPAAGEETALNAFWSHADVSQSAASAAGSAPPVTKPKYRGPGDATSPGSTARASSSTMRSARHAALRRRPAEDGAQLGDRGARTRRALVDAVQVRDREVGGGTQERGIDSRHRRSFPHIPGLRYGTWSVAREPSAALNPSLSSADCTDCV